MAQGICAPRVTARAHEILSGIKILQNPYLTGLKDGTVSMDCFRTTQEQFYFAVDFYPRPMAALVGRIPDPVARLEILRNVVEEHGEFRMDAFHRNTFRRFLESLGSKVERIDALWLWPEVRAFNSVLTTACVFDEIEVGVGCLGIIELAFSGISSVIANAVVERGWVKRESLTHYSVHAELDVRHADDFFAVLEPVWDDASRKYFIEQGLQLGAYAFDRLYRDLHASAKRAMANGAPDALM